MGLLQRDVLFNLPSSSCVPGLPQSVLIHEHAKKVALHLIKDFKGAKYPIVFGSQKSRI